MMDFKKNPRTDFKDVGKLSQEQARQEIEALREGIEYHDYLYYVKDQPAISDETYDKLFRRLQDLEQAFPEQDIPSFLAVRGEVFMHKGEFQKLNKTRIENGEEPFANPRNAAAGMVRQLDPKRVAGTSLDIVFYDILELRDRSFASDWEMLGQLPKWGLRTDPHHRKCSNLEQIEQYHTDMSEERDTLDYEIDGVATETVSDDVDYVVVGRDPGRKLDEAKKKNVKTIKENVFQKLVGSQSGG